MCIRDRHLEGGYFESDMFLYYMLLLQNVIPDSQNTGWDVYHTDTYIVDS